MSKIRKKLSALRLFEITGKMGFIFIGSLFAHPQISWQTFYDLLMLYVLCLFLGLSIYSFNSYSGYRHDIHNHRLSSSTTLSQKKYGWYSIVFAALSILTMTYFDFEVWVVVLLMLIIWGVYVLPSISLKSIPIAGLLVAFLAQLLHFHLGYLVFNILSIPSVLIAVYFALLFAAGHALHEVIDYDADKVTGLKTSAVRFGVKILSHISIGLFGIAAIYWGGLYHLDIVTGIQCAGYVVAFGCQLLTWIVISRNDLFMYRKLYMIFYFVATVVIFTTSYWI